MTEIGLRGIPASGGIAIGPAHRLQPARHDLPQRKADPFEEEWRSFALARQAAGEELAELRRRMAVRVGENEAAIFDAHRAMVDDPMLIDRVRERLQQNVVIEQAVTEAAAEIAGRLATLPDATLAARSADVIDVGNRLVRILLGRPALDLSGLREPAVVVAEDLTPSDTAALDPMMTLGFCTAGGGLTSHTAILARTLGLPAVVGLGEALLESVTDGDELVLDGGEGVVWVAPSAALHSDYRRRQQAQRRRAEIWRSGTPIEAHTADGRRVEVAANVGDLASARQAAASGAEGIGLLRTEFLFLEANRAPSEEDQRSAYAGIFEAMGGKPVIVRTLDIGGDKPPPYLAFPRELNPFLGWRAIRVSLERTDLFATQIRAILRAAVGYNVRIMLPMVSALEEVRQARVLVAQAEADLAKEGHSFARGLPLGIMVETPAAAVLVDMLAGEAEFFSLGTNDLTQYTLAVDRGNARVAPLFQPLHPAVLRLIHMAIDSAHRAGKWVGMCGELAGLRKAIPILVGLGLDELSMAPGSIPEAKALIALLESGQARRLADEVLALGTSAEVAAKMDGFLANLGWAV
jgi:phosphoenolpyruvate-protein phosphotransferase